MFVLTLGKLELRRLSLLVGKSQNYKKERYETLSPSKIIMDGRKLTVENDRHEDIITTTQRKQKS